LIRPPSWRNRSTPRRRHRFALVTFGFFLVPGLLVMVAAIAALGRAGSPTWAQVLPWLVPMLGVLVWSLSGPTPADATDYEEQSWSGYVIRYVLIGEEVLRPRLERILVAVLVGGPIGWAMIVISLLALVGIG